MNIWLEIYLIGATAMTILSHGLASNPNVHKASARGMLVSVIFWPVGAILYFFEK